MSTDVAVANARDLHARALELHAEARQEEAVTLLREALGATLDVEILNDLAVMLHGLGDTPAAELLLHTCLVLKPGEPLATENLRGLQPARCIVEAGPALAYRLTRLTGIAPDVVQRVLLRPGAPVDVPVGALGGASFRLRPGTSDVRQFEDSFEQLWHLPPFELDDPRLIVDLGANIGTTMAHFAHLYPAARVIGIELDDENVELCRANVAAFGDRCTVLHGALSAQDGHASYSRGAGDEWGYSIVGGDGDITVEALSIDTLLERHAPGQAVDYLKMDIEGAEIDVLRTGGDWAQRVRCLNLEPHPPYTEAEATADLERLGFRVQPARREGCFVAVR
jgi:FkbM family methyltransferase